jgi:2-polyprenyl-3-methyl-5-hydroxy-6-metoxy-1,4-benzoquinol methylase
MQSKNHWEKVYSTRPETEVSWFQQHARRSIKLIRKYMPDKTSSIIDVGGGASTLVDDLLEAGYRNLSVLDLSNEALAKSRSRLGEMASQVNWIAADVTQASLPAREFDVWHDRAVFHFLTSEQERHAYKQQVLDSVKPDALVIIATFAEDGPESCSGLPVMRYNADQLHAELGKSFLMLGHEYELHQTPWKKEQRFIYCYYRKLG